MDNVHMLVERRMQIELREIIDDMILTGWEVESRGPVLMKCLHYKVEVRLLESGATAFIAA